MNKVHFIPNPGGEELVLLPRSEYEALLERAEAGASASAHAVEREIEEARAADQMIPFEIVEAIADGGNPVRELRRCSGQRAMSGRCSVVSSSRGRCGAEGASLKGEDR